jgi:hypothetical protein
MRRSRNAAMRLDARAVEFAGRVVAAGQAATKGWKRSG